MRWNGDTGRVPRLFVADRQPMIAEALAALLRNAGYEVTGLCHDGAEAESALAAGGIDMALLDIDLEKPGPAQLLEGLIQRAANIAVIITAPHATHHAVGAMITANAHGLVLKSESADNIGHCIAAIRAGGQWYDQAAMAHAKPPAPDVALTRRECDVAKLVAGGRRNRDIAAALGISEGTVKMHLHNVYTKFGLESRTQLAMDKRLRAQL